METSSVAALLRISVAVLITSSGGLAVQSASALADLLLRGDELRERAELLALRGRSTPPDQVGRGSPYIRLDRIFQLTEAITEQICASDWTTREVIA
jgi:hypothetical protein